MEFLTNMKLSFSISVSAVKAVDHNQELVKVIAISETWLLHPEFILFNYLRFCLMVYCCIYRRQASKTKKIMVGFICDYCNHDKPVYCYTCMESPIYIICKVILYREHQHIEVAVILALLGLKYSSLFYIISM